MDQNPLVMKPGATFGGRYEVVRCVAAGGMGAVYEVVDTTIQKTRALKVMLPQLVSNDQLRARFKQEATVVSRVHSQHIVDITDAGVDPATGAPFIVMEYLVGSDLQDVLKDKGPMKPHQLAELIRQAALALDRTHGHGIVHRDLKPENLFVTLRDDGTPHLKVLDFGIAKVVADGMRSGNQTATIGTPAYMAPEQIQSKADIGAATDVYSLAMVAYTMLVGEAYYAEELDLSENAFQIIVAVSKGVAEPAKQRAMRRKGVELPDAIDLWFSRATALNPAERYPSAGALATAFGQAVGTAGDLRMSLPDGVGSASMSTGEFLAGQSMQTGGSGRISQPTEVGGPVQWGAGQAAAINASARTISAAIADPPPTAKKKAAKWPYAVVGAIAVAGAGFTIVRVMDDPKRPAATTDDEDQEKEPTPAASATATSSAAAQALTSCPEGMVLIARATFPMGGTEGEAKPVHKVTVGPYCIDKTEVTVEKYRACVEAGKCAARTSTEGLDQFEMKLHEPHCNYGKPDRNDHPMNCVSWSDADGYCEFVKKRLPTEPEWELAARGAEGRDLPWGTGTATAKHVNGCGQECRQLFGKGAKQWDVLFSDDDGFAATAPVGKYPSGASPFGVLDMAGNVSEWTADWLVPYEASVSTVEDPPSPAKPADNPRRAVRGGSFLSFSTELISPWSRSGWNEDKRAATAGFRCALR